MPPIARPMPVNRMTLFRTVAPSARALIYIALVMIVFSLAPLGCCNCDKKLPPVLEPVGRTEALDLYNRNIQAIASFKARLASWEVAYPEDDKIVRHQGNAGTVFYRPPVNGGYPRFYLQADKELLASEALVLGCNEEEYWMYSRPAKRGWWGRYRHLDKDCSTGGALNPHTLMDLIGLRPVDPPAAHWSVYKVGERDYTLSLTEMTDDGLLLRREIVVSRGDHLPREVTLYDADGQALIRCELSDYLTLGQAKLPGRIYLYHDRNDSYLKLRLKDLKEDERARDCLFTKECRADGLEEFVQIDRDCDEL